MDKNMKRRDVRNREYSHEDVVNSYMSGKSLNQMYEDLGVSPVTAKKILAKYGVDLRKEQIEYKDVILELSNKNIGKEEIYDLYIVQGKSQAELANFIEEHTGFKVGHKIISSLLKNFEIKKTAEQIKRAQGNKSSSEKAYSFSLLKQAGFDSVKELAEFYEKESNMTYSDICDMLNKKIGKEIFTPRWLGRHMAKEVTEKTKTKVSVAENSLLKYIQSIYDDEVLQSNYNIIPPKEIDIYLPKKKIAIEFNGLYWHSDKFIVSNHGITAYEYHLNKYLECAKQDIQLVFVWEDDWTEEKTEIENAIKQLLDNGIVDPRLMRLQ